MKWLLGQSKAHPAATFVRLKPSVDISFTALLYFGATLFIGVAAMNSQTNLLFGVFGMMIGVLLVAGYISRFSVKKLFVNRGIPDHLVVGDPSTLSYSIRNGKRFWPSIAVSLGEIDGCEGFMTQPYGYLLHAPPSSSRLVTVPLMPKRRGIHELNCYQVSTSFPFGFVKRAVLCHERDPVVVFPALAQVDPAILLKCHSAENAGARMRPRKGGHDEFYGLREYRTGENPRLIHWKRSARTGDMVIREMTRVSPPRLLIVLDTYLGYDGCTSADAERAIAVGASLASLALGRGYPVGLFAYSGDFLHVPADRGKRHRRELLTQMAQLGRNISKSHEPLIDAAVGQLTPGTTLVLVTPAESGGGNGQRRKGRFVVLCTRDPETMRYFAFRPNIDFAHSMPVDQEAEDFRTSRPELFEAEQPQPEAADV